MTEIIYNITATAGREIALTGLTTELSKNNVLGIINKTTGKVLYTPLKYTHMSATYSNGTLTITLDSTIDALSAGDNVFIKCYTDSDGGLSTLKSDLQGNDPTATLTAIMAALQSDSEDIPEDVPEGVNEKLVLIMQYLGVPSSISYTALTQAEVIASTRAEQVNAWGEDGCPIPNYLPTGVTEAMVEAAATALGITYYEPNFNIATL